MREFRLLKRSPPTGASPHPHKRQLSLAYSYKSTNRSVGGGQRERVRVCVDVVYLIYVNTLDSSKREHRHALSDMLFCAFWSKKPWHFPYVLCFFGWDRFEGFESFHTKLYLCGSASYTGNATWGEDRGQSQKWAHETAKSVEMSKK
jgi:hypothetical protein